jgi:hypothetical protein
MPYSSCAEKKAPSHSWLSFYSPLFFFLAAVWPLRRIEAILASGITASKAAGNVTKFRFFKAKKKSRNFYQASKFRSHVNNIANSLLQINNRAHARLFIKIET